MDNHSIETFWCTNKLNLLKLGSDIIKSYTNNNNNSELQNKRQFKIDIDIDFESIFDSEGLASMYLSDKGYIYKWDTILVQWKDFEGYYEEHYAKHSYERFNTEKYLSALSLRVNKELKWIWLRICSTETKRIISITIEIWFIDIEEYKDYISSLIQKRIVTMNTSLNFEEIKKQIWNMIMKMGEDYRSDIISLGELDFINIWLNTRNTLPEINYEDAIHVFNCYFPNSLIELVTHYYYIQGWLSILDSNNISTSIRINPNKLNYIIYTWKFQYFPQNGEVRYDNEAWTILNWRSEVFFRLLYESRNIRVHLNNIAKALGDPDIDMKNKTLNEIYKKRLRTLKGNLPEFIAKHIESEETWFMLNDQ